MRRTPSSNDLQRLVLDLFGAVVMLRNTGKSGVLSSDEECNRLANCIEDWLEAGENQIISVFKQNVEPREVIEDAPITNVVELARSRIERNRFGQQKIRTPREMERLNYK